MAQKGKKTKKEKTNKPIDFKKYNDAIRSSVHFPFKLRNSNLPSGGVRIARNAPKNLPYVALSGLSDPELFLIENKGNASGFGIIKDANSVFLESLQKLSENEKEELNIAEVDKREILKIVEEALSESQVVIDEERPLSPRFCQVLMPLGEKEYLSVVPLPSPSLAGYIVDEAWRASKSGDNRLSLRQAYLKYGGNNPQNVGVLIYNMMNPLLFFGPTESINTRRVWAYYYRGVSTKVLEQDVKAYFDFLMRLGKRRNQGKLASYRYRRIEKEHVEAIVKTVLNRGRRAYAALVSFDGLPGDRVMDPSVPLLRQGLIDPSKRTDAWRHDFAWHIARQIVNYEFRDKTIMPLNVTETGALAKMIEEFLP